MIYWTYFIDHRQLWIMNIKLAVFDMAGTTINDDGAVQKHLYLALQNEMKGTISFDDVNDLMGYPKPTAISILLKKYCAYEEKIADEITQKIHRNFLSALDDHYNTTNTLKQTPYAEEIFLYLKEKGIKVVLDTGFGASTAKIILRRLQWLEKGLIDSYITSDDVANGRPEPDMIWAAMERYGIKSALEVIKVGDTKSDMIQGTKAGCRFVVGVTTGAFSRDRLSCYPHTHLIENLIELKSILS